MMSERSIVYLLLFLLVIILFSSISPVIIDSFAYEYFNRLWLGSFCHIDPDRAISVNGKTFILCSRCTGIYASLFMGLIAAITIKTKLFPKKIKLILLAVTFSIILVDVFGNIASIWTNTIWSRFLIGSLFGISLSIFFFNKS